MTEVYFNIIVPKEAVEEAVRRMVEERGYSYGPFTYTYDHAGNLYQMELEARKETP